VNNEFAKQATLHYLMAARMGHEGATLAVFDRSTFGHPDLLDWAELVLDGKIPPPADWNGIPEWIRREPGKQGPLDDIDKRTEERLLKER
jgi:hypothetical protein